jgi:hypothetical protein
MNHSSLQYILKIKELSSYLSNEELVKFSMCSKKLRDSLSPLIFNSFNFEKFINIKDYSGGVITDDCDEYDEIDPLLLQTDPREDGDIEDDDTEDDFDEDVEEDIDEDSEGVEEDSEDDIEDDYGDEPPSFIRNPYGPLPKSYLESKDKLQSDLNQLQYRPNKLNINDVKGYDYLINDLYSAFSNIGTLKISSSMIQFETFQYLLDNLSYLVDLELTKSILVKRSTNTNSYSINWPLNLKKLKLGDNEFGLVGNDDDYIKSDVFGHPKITLDDLIIEPKRLPSLHTLVLEPTDFKHEYFTDNDDQFLKILKANSHVKTLDICLHNFKPEFFEIIKSFGSLTKLKLTICNFEDIEAFKTIKKSGLPNLKSLDLTLYDDTSIFSVIAEQFPNLINLSYYPEKLKLNDIWHYASSLEKFENLKTLKLQSIQTKPPKKLTLPKLKNLVSLEIFIGKFFNLNILANSETSCPNLKLVKFTKFTKYSVFELPELSEELEAHYRFVYFPYTLSFYKID